MKGKDYDNPQERSVLKTETISHMLVLSSPQGRTLFPSYGQHPAKGKGIMSDERISLCGSLTRDKYPQDLRLIRFYDEEREKTFTFLTNNFRLAATTISQIYKSRWQIALFFKWIKQNLKIKSFLSTSKNAVLTQIWVAMCYYLLLTYIKYQTRYGYSLLH